MCAITYSHPMQAEDGEYLCRPAILSFDFTMKASKGDYHEE